LSGNECSAPCLLVGLFDTFRLVSLGKVPANEKLPPVFSCLIKQNRQDELLLIRERNLLRGNSKLCGEKMRDPKWICRSVADAKLSAATPSAHIISTLIGCLGNSSRYAARDKVIRPHNQRVIS
jgi:hypothetical protein